MPLRKIGKIVRTVNAAYKDADHARKMSNSADFRRAVKEDRRGTLSEFRTVKHALRDRESIAKKSAAGAPKKSGSKKK
jgi:pyruvoyl-dependent arginine decarboxylase (PvlArgDC)